MREERVGTSPGPQAKLPRHVQAGGGQAGATLGWLVRERSPGGSKDVAKTRSLAGPQLLRSLSKGEKAGQSLVLGRPVGAWLVAQARVHQGSRGPQRVPVCDAPGVPGVSSGHCAGTEQDGVRPPTSLPEAMPTSALAPK